MVKVIPNMILAILFTCLIEKLQAQGYSIDTVATTGYNNNTAMFIDPTGVVHIVYTNRETGIVYYSNDSTGQFDPPTPLFTSPPFQYAAGVSAFSADRNRKLHLVIAAYFGGVPQLFYATNSSGSFTYSQINSPDATINTYGQASMALDTAGKAYVAFKVPDRGGTNTIFKLFFTTNRAGSFSTPIEISDSLRELDEVQMARSSNGAIHILFDQQLLSGLFYRAIYNDTLQSKVKLAANAGWPRLAIDSLNSVHIIYSSHTRLFYIRVHDSIFQNPTPLTLDSLEVKVVPTLFLSSDGQLYVTYQNNLNYGSIRLVRAVPTHLPSSDTSTIAQGEFVLWYQNLSVFQQTIHVAYSTYGDFPNDRAVIHATHSTATSVQEQPIGSPIQFHLLQNYPNPFNPSTTISFNLTSSTDVSLDIFDVLGRQVGTLVSERLSAGVHTVRWNAGDASSGVYFYRLRVM